MNKIPQMVSQVVRQIHPPGPAQLVVTRTYVWISKQNFVIDLSEQVYTTWYNEKVLNNKHWQ